jgi:hypothetical protein
MKFISLKNSPKEIKEEKAEGTAPSYEPPEYPYGTCLDLEGEQFDRMGLDGQAMDDELDCLLEGDEEFEVVAKVKIRRFEKSRVARAGEEPESRDCLSLQVTQLAIPKLEELRKKAKADERFGELAGRTK